MLCTQCEQRDAALHFEAVVNGRRTVSDLCRVCARKAGIGSALSGETISFPALAPEFAALLQILSGWKPTVAAPPSCPRCRWTLALLRRTGKMGCPDCYPHFRTAAEKVLAQVQPDVVNRGKRPAGS